MNKTEKKIILHIITGLETGGAEKMLLKILKGHEFDDFEVYVVSLSDKSGKQVEFYRKTKASLFFFDLHCNIFKKCIKFFRLYRFLKKLSPTITIAWMYHSILISVIFSSILLRHKKVIWNIRHTPYNLMNEKFLTRNIIKLLRTL